MEEDILDNELINKMKKIEENYLNNYIRDDLKELVNEVINNKCKNFKQNIFYKQVKKIDDESNVLNYKNNKKDAQQDLIVKEEEKSNKKEDIKNEEKENNKEKIKEEKQENKEEDIEKEEEEIEKEEVNKLTIGLKASKPILEKSGDKNDKKELNNQIIGIRFLSQDQKINYPIACSLSDIFSEVEKKLFLQYPELKNKNIYYIGNGNKINRDETIEKNEIKHESCLIIIENEDEENVDIPILETKIIIIHFLYESQNFKLNIACNPSDFFLAIENKLYLELPILRKKNLSFFLDGKMIIRSATIEENGIKDNCTILIFEFE